MGSSCLRKVISLVLEFNGTKSGWRVKLQALIQVEGKQAALVDVSGLAEDHP